MSALDGVTTLDVTRYEAGISCIQASEWLGARAFSDTAEADGSAMIKALRTRTGVGFGDCTKALSAEVLGRVADGIATGRVRKFLSESSLVEQPFVKDASAKVDELLSAASATCTGFERFEVGEGLG